MLIIISTITGCVSISAFASLVSIPIGNTSPATGLKICVITAGIKEFKSINKNKKKHDKIVLIAKSKLNQCWLSLKCKKNTESKNPKLVKTKNGRKCFYKNVQCVITAKSNKLVDYKVV